MIRDKTTNKARRAINRLKKKLEKERLKRIYKSTKADRKKRWRNINNFKQKRFIEEMRKSQYATLVSEWDYDEILGQCLELLKKCDGIVMAGDWEKSNGCQREKKLAERLGLEIYYFKCYGMNIQDIYK